MILGLSQKNLSTFIAIIIAILTTGFLRVHWITFLPEPDGGLYTFFSQYFYTKLSNGEPIGPGYPVALYSLMTSWIFSLEVNQYVALRWIDLCLAIIASILFFKIIEKESGSILFTTVLVGTLLLVMNNHSFVLYGFRNSIWAAYVPLFLALLISQKTNSQNQYLFFLIGGLVTLGVLLREPFLFFYLVGAIAILLNYGLKIFFKYLIGSAILGFSVLFALIILRGGASPLIIIESYIGFAGAMQDLTDELLVSNFFKNGLIAIKAYWFGITISLFSTIYILKLIFKNKKLINIKRLIFWSTLAIIPIVEPLLKLGFDYHFINCIPGLAGISAMGWKYLSINESKLIKKYVMIGFIFLSIFGSLPNFIKTINMNVYKQKNVVSNAYNHLSENNFSKMETIVLSNYLIAADMIKHLSRENSTLATAGFAQVLYPLTGLLPPTFKLMDLRMLYQSINWNEDKLVNILKKEKPTIIFPTSQMLPGIKNLTRAIARTNLYERVAIVSYSPEVYYKSISGDIYRLKDFE